MGDKSKIEWTEATWNPVTGCSKVSQGCKHCYAERLFPRVYPGRAFTEVQCHPERLDQPLHWRKPRRIFVNSMSDLFHEAVPFEFIRKIFIIMAHTPHQYQILTKRPQRLLEWFQWIDPDLAAMSPELLDICAMQPWPLRNVWLGVSCENQAMADERIPLLLQVPAAVRFLSLEPLLGPITLEPWLLCGFEDIDWVIVGGESGPKAQPMHPDWARAIRDECQAAGVPFFFKQWGAWQPDGLFTNLRKRGCLMQPSGAMPDLETDLPVMMAGHFDFTGHQHFSHVGKQAAGRLLDGRTWDEMPGMAAALHNYKAAVKAVLQEDINR